MNIPEEAYQIIILIILVSIAMCLVAYFTKDSRNFRSSRNRKARRQH
ncbi:hypothetical protein [Winogradskyella maritima]